MRADGRGGAGHRRQQAPRRDRRGRPRRADRHHRARRGARPAERRAAPARAVVPRRRQHVGAGDDRRHGRQQFLRLALDPLRQYGPQRRGDRRAAGRRHRGTLRRLGGDGRRADTRALADRIARCDRPPRARRDRPSRAAGPAPRWRLQHRRVRPAERASLHAGRQRESRASARRQRGDARVVAHADAEPRAAAAAPDARHRQLSDALPRDAVRGGDRHARADSGRARRSHDDRPRAREPGISFDDRRRPDRRAGRDPSRRVHRRDPRRAGREARAAGRADGRSRAAGQRRVDDRRRRAEGARGRCARPGSTS